MNNISRLVGLASVALAVSLLPMCAVATAGGWSSAQASTGDLRSVSCPSTSTCYAAGGAALTSPVVAKTSDGGHSWRQLPVAAGSNYFYGISCPSSSSCVAVGYNGAIQTTADGGASWTVRANPYAGSYHEIRAVSCGSVSACVAVTNYQGTTLVTSDGGATWTLRAGAVSGLLAPALYGVSCPSASTCYAVSSDQAVWKTTDGGATWSARQLPPDTLTLKAVSCATIAACVAVGDEGTIVATTDGGQTWIAQHNPVPMIGNSLFGVSCISAQQCYAGGGSGTILSTVDGGTTWASQPSPSPQTMIGVACSGVACVMVGQGGVAFANDAASAAAGGANATAPRQDTTCTAGTPAPHTVAGLGHIYFQRGSQIYAARGDGSNAHALTGDGTAAQPDLSPAVSPDGSLVAYARGLHVYVIPAAGGAPRSVGDGIQEVNDPTFSPNGRCVTYRWLVTLNGATNIVQYFTEQTNNVASGKIVKNDSGFLTGLYPAWSPDGSMMVASVIHSQRVVAQNEHHFAIDAVDVAAARAARFNGTPVSSRILVGDGQHDFRYPAFSPNDSGLAYVQTDSPTARSGDLYVASSNGTSPNLLVRHVAAGRVAWSPDGKAIAFGGQGNLYVDRVGQLSVLERNASSIAWGL